MNMIKTTALALAATVAVGSIGSVASSTPAEAGKRHFIAKKHFKKHRNHRHFGHHFAFGYNYGYGPNCRYLKRKARWTGSRYWWKRYRQCVNYYY